ncbi:hypothetical protein [Bacillus sp. 179-C3.3 HS]|uniref:hypothetical protein n=1 Tax=Bacillus sp. 179-C3.3 HS TaxID=3232162 RepID=UPI0039A2B5CA
MKKSLFLSMSFLIVMLLSACTDQSMEPNENNMILSIKNNANFDFYSIEISTDKTTGGISNADGSNIQKGDTLRTEYIDQEDFDLEGESTFEFVLIGKEGNRIPLKEMTLELMTNKEYLFEITGDSIKEADLKRVK